VSRIWRASIVQPHRSETFMLSPDPLFINNAREDLAVHLTVDRYLAMYNEAPTPFVSAKTADEIIASVARVCHRISDSGH
jgi:hypothetical protein